MTTEGGARSDAEPKAIFMKAVAAHQSGDLDGAERLYLQVLEADPKSLAARANLAIVCFQRGDGPGGVAWLDRSLAIEPRQPQTLANRAAAKAGLGRYEAALADCEAALAIDPACIEAAWHRPGVLEHLGRPGEALIAWQRLLQLDPANAVAATNLSALLRGEGRMQEALAAVDRALELAPGLAKAWNNRGSFLIELGRDAEGVESLERSVALDPSDPDAFYNLGSGLLKLHRGDEAVAAFDAAIALKPDFPAAYWNKGVVLLAAGRGAEGWPLFEWRWGDPGLSDVLRQLPAPTWTGAEDIAGKTLLVHYEQGFGDTLQMARYLPMLRETGAKVVLAAQPELLPLTQGMADVVLGRGGTIPPHDFKIFSMSLPLAMGAARGVIPNETPYLAAPPQAAARWAVRLGPWTRRRVGLTWSGNPGHVNDHNRSLALAQLLPLLDADADFHSLQTQYRAGDAAVLRTEPRIADHAADLTDFGQTAGLIEALDLVIAVDTAVVHLAGALGKRVWILLPYIVDYRWEWEGSTTPWYPTARLFRQPKPGDWTSVIAEVSAALKTL